MKLSGLAAISCAALVLAAIAEEASAGGRSSGRSVSGASRSSSHSGTHHSGSHSNHRHHSHRHHSHSRVFVGFGAPLFWGPPVYYGPVYYYPPPPAPVYIQQHEAPLEQDSQQYWYYCPSPGAYYPYVGECPEGWQRVLPHPNPQPPAG